MTFVVTYLLILPPISTIIRLMILLENRKVRFDYEIIETLEVGLALLGWEVKSIKSKNANLKSAWVGLKGGEAILNNFKITPWRYSREEQDQFRPKKILMHKAELLKWESKMQEKNYTLVPYKIYLKKGRIKCEVCLVKGRKRHEKRQVLKERAQQKEARKALKEL